MGKCLHDVPFLKLTNHAVSYKIMATYGNYKFLIYILSEYAYFVDESEENTPSLQELQDYLSDYQDLQESNHSN